MNTQLTPGQTAYRQWGNLHVRIDCHDEGVSINVTHHPVLDRTFTNLGEGRAYLRLLKTEALKGTQVFLIEAAAGVLTSASAVLNDAEQVMVDGIRANLDCMTATQPSAIDVSDIVGGDNGYQAERKRAREQAARFVSRTQVHLKPPTEAELGRIRAHVNGVVTCGPGQNWTLLRAIERKGLGVGVPEVAGRPKLAYLRLNARGMAYVEQGSVAA